MLECLGNAQAAGRSLKKVRQGQSTKPLEHSGWVSAAASGGRGAMEYDASDDVTFTRNLDSSQAVNVVEYLLFTKIVVSARPPRSGCMSGAPCSTPC